MEKAASRGGLFRTSARYSVDSISKPQASSNGSGIYLEFLLRRAHSRRRVERMYWSGVSLNSFTACSNEVTIGITGPIGSGLPQLGLPRLFAIFKFVLPLGDKVSKNSLKCLIPFGCIWIQLVPKNQEPAHHMSP